MTKSRVEAFSDGVIAIIITIMVLEMKVPHENGASLSALRPLLPVFLSYVLSFTMVLIYWNNHHHMFQSVNHVNGRILLANGHLLFWLSLCRLPLHGWAKIILQKCRLRFFGTDLLMCAIAFVILTRGLIHLHGSDSALAKAVGVDSKGIISIIIYVMAIAIAFFVPLISCCLYIVVAIIWIIPDMRIEKELQTERSIRLNNFYFI